MTANQITAINISAIQRCGSNREITHQTFVYVIQTGDVHVKYRHFWHQHWQANSVKFFQVSDQPAPTIQSFALNFHAGTPEFAGDFLFYFLNACVSMLQKSVPFLFKQQVSTAVQPTNGPPLLRPHKQHPTPT